MSRNYHQITSTYPIESYLNEPLTAEPSQNASTFTQRQLKQSQSAINFDQDYEVVYNQDEQDCNNKNLRELSGEKRFGVNTRHEESDITRGSCSRAGLNLSVLTILNSPTTEETDQMSINKSK